MPNLAKPFEKAAFKVAQIDASDNYGKFVIEPLERGYGLTIGNSLRRILLSSLPGAAVCGVVIEGAQHEFSALKGIEEDVTTIILNLRDIIFVSDDESKEEMKKVAFYATKSFCKGTDLLARGCYLFYHNPKAFERYATSSIDFQEDVRQSSFDEENVFMPTLAIFPSDTVIAERQASQEEYHPENRRLPLLSFAPIKCGIHPSQIEFQVMLDHHKGLFSDPSLRPFQYDFCRYEPLKQLLCSEQPESNYPNLQHKAIVVALNEFNRRLEREPVHICAHKGKPSTPNVQHTRE